MISPSRHQLDAEVEEDTKISYKVHTQVRRMMSEKRQRKKNLKTGEGEPDIRVTEEVEGRVAGTAKTLMDARVHEMMAEEEGPPPPYTSSAGAGAKGAKGTAASFRLTGGWPALSSPLLAFPPLPPFLFVPFFLFLNSSCPLSISSFPLIFLPLTSLPPPLLLPLSSSPPLLPPPSPQCPTTV